MNFIKRVIVKIWGQKYTTQEKHCASVAIGVVYVTSPLSIKWIAYFSNIKLEDTTRDFDKVFLVLLISCIYLTISHLTLYCFFMGTTNFFKKLFLKNKQKI